MHKWKEWRINTIYKNKFPKQLLAIKNIPEKLYYRGNWDNKLFENTLVIVGSRRMTRYGVEQISRFMPDFISKKLSIISGFMYGVDTEAHNQCINNGGTTIAILGSGLDYLTTIENDDLYTKILQTGGLVISEYEPNFVATRWSFPQRNRIVAGLATLGILIVEAGLKSGSLITARLGNELGRQVFVVPGNINSISSEGCNWLIKNNKAKMVTNICDILADTISTQINLFDSSLSKLEISILKLLEMEPLTLDEITKKINSTVSEISVAVSTLLMKNLVNEDMGKVYLNRLQIDNSLNY